MLTAETLEDAAGDCDALASQEGLPDSGPTFLGANMTVSPQG